MFQRALVRKPCRNFIHGLTTAGLGKPDYEKALRQHSDYIEALKFCGLEVIVLEADERYPDSVFVEDPAVVTDRMAVIARPGARTRRGEEDGIADALKPFFCRLERIQTPGTLEGGDVMKAGDRFFVGLSQRTNREGFEQFARILEKYGYAATAVPLRHVLHLKTGVAYLEYNDLIATGEFPSDPIFEEFRIIPVGSDESYAANSIWVNGRVLIPQGFEKTRRAVEDRGYPVLTVDVSEFRKLDGGLSCLSLRF
jgi:dimethylargininase